MKGLALILTLLITALAIVIVSGSAGIFIAELAASRQIHLSTVAFYVADAGIEGALYAERINNPRTGTAGLEATTDDCTPNHNGTDDVGNENSDTCLDSLDIDPVTHDGFYSYTVQNDVGDPRIVTSTGEYRGIKRAIEVRY